MTARGCAPSRRSWSRSLGAAVAVTLLVGGVVVGTAQADGVDSQKQKVASIADQLDGIQNKIAQLDNDYNAAQDRKDQLDKDIVAAQTKVDTQQAQLDQLQGTIGQIAVDKYTSGDNTTLSPVFSDAATYSDAQQRNELNRLSLDSGAGDVDEAAAIATQLAKDKATLDNKQRQAADVVQTLNSKKDQATKLETQYQNDYAAAKAELGDLIQQEQDRRAAAEVAKAEEISAQQAAADKTRAEASAAAAAAATKAASAPRSNGSTPAATPAPTSAATSASAPRGGGGGGNDNGAAATPASGNDSPASPNPSPTADASPPADPSPSANPSPSADPSPPPPSSRAGTALAAAESQLGVPYRFAAESPGQAFDCSGLTKYAWGLAGVSLPHEASQQFASTPHVTQDQIQPGDLLYYHSPIGHVAIYIGGGQLIHAPRTGDVVKISPVNWGNVVGISRPG